MFVKWQKRHSKWPGRFGDLLMASLVESRRVNGKPRHKLITYLGSIRERAAQGGPDRAVNQDDFWRDVARRLGRSGLLGNRITPEDLAKIEEALAKRVRQPTKAEVGRALAKGKELVMSYKNINGQLIHPDPTDELIREYARSPHLTTPRSRCPLP